MKIYRVRPYLRGNSCVIDDDIMITDSVWQEGERMNSIARWLYGEEESQVAVNVVLVGDRANVFVEGQKIGHVDVVEKIEIKMGVTA